MRYRRNREAGGTYFFTVVTESRRPILATDDGVALLKASIAKVQQNWPFDLEALVVLPDHLHTMWTLPDGDFNYSTRWRLIKEYFTRPWIASHPGERSSSRAAKGEQTVWQRRFWEHTIRDEKDFDNHLDYIHANPVHHRLVTRPQDWPHSTSQKWVARGLYTVDWMSPEPQLSAWAARYE